MHAANASTAIRKSANVPATGARNEAVDVLIDRAPAFAQPILRELREIVHEAVPDAVEEIKWSRTFFCVDGTLLCQMSAFTRHCGFGFWAPEMTPLLQADGIEGLDGSGAFGRITSMADLPSRKKLIGYIRRAAALARSGTAGSPVAKRRRTSAKAPIPMPEEFAALLTKSSAAKATFEALPPSARREYLEWITIAKRSETRERRMNETVQRLASGRRFNEEYQAKESKHPQE
jgi:hypothetical protein